MIRKPAQPFKNSTVAFDASGLFSPAYELYAQSYAIEVYAKTISEINRKNKTIDILIGSNGFMQCTAKWAAYRNTGNLGTPPVSQGDSCLAPVPADYQPGG